MERIEVYKLDNSKMQVELLNLGAIIRSIKIRDCNGVMRDVVLGLDDVGAISRKSMFLWCCCRAYRK